MGAITHQLGQFCRKCNGVHPYPSLTKNQLAYTAGIFDAEGSVWCTFGHGRKNFGVSLYVCNTYKPVLERIHSWITFGAVNQRVSGPSHRGKKPVYQWVCYNTELAKYLLNLLLPYLRVKREKVERMLRIKVEDAPMSWAYLAGFFDGDGCASARLSAKHQRYIGYSFSIGQKTCAVLDEMKQFLGCGNVCFNGGFYHFRLDDHKGQKRFIDHILPFAIVKCQKLQEAKALIESKNWGHGGKWTYVRLDIEPHQKPKTPTRKEKQVKREKSPKPKLRLPSVRGTISPPPIIRKQPILPKPLPLDETWWRRIAELFLIITAT